MEKSWEFILFVVILGVWLFLAPTIVKAVPYLAEWPRWGRVLACFITGLVGAVVTIVCMHAVTTTIGLARKGKKAKKEE